MAHYRYQTEAVILGSVSRGESNRAFFLLTKDFGLIAAIAQGARALSSKLRYALSDLSHVRVDLLRVEDMWRIVDAENMLASREAFDVRALRAFARSARLLRRLMHGERKESVLYNEVCAYRLFLLREHPSSDASVHMEIAMAVKALYALGYGGESSVAERVASSSFGASLNDFVAAHRINLLSFIKAGLRESHL